MQSRREPHGTAPVRMTRTAAPSIGRAPCVDQLQMGTLTPPSGRRRSRPYWAEAHAGGGLGTAAASLAHRPPSSPKTPSIAAAGQVHGQPRDLVDTMQSTPSSGCTQRRSCQTAETLARHSDSRRHALWSSRVDTAHRRRTLHCTGTPGRPPCCCRHAPHALSACPMRPERSFLLHLLPGRPAVRRSVPRTPCSRLAPAHASRWLLRTRSASLTVDATCKAVNAHDSAT